MPRPIACLTLPAPIRAAAKTAQLVAVCMAFALAACGENGKTEIKDLKAEVQLAYGQKEFKKGLDASQKGLALSRKINGDKAPDTLYFAQAISENNLNLNNYRAAIPALKLEIDLRATAGQSEAKLQARRTLLIKLAEENNDKLTAADQAVMVARGIEMGPGKNPQPVYRPPTTYPVEQFRQKVEGDVDIAYSLDASGAVTEARVAQATPPAVFDQAALESFRKWRFTPMLDRNGKPVAGSGFKFTLAFRMGGR